MSEFVRQAAFGGYKSVAGGHSDPECTHVIMTKKEYDALLAAKRRAEQEGQNAKYEADRSIQRIKNEAQHKVYQANTDAQQQVDAMAQELAGAQAEAAYQRGLNANLLRIARERANADRKLKPKKDHSGFVVVSSGEKECRYKDGNRNWRTALLRETVLQSPYSVDFTETQARKQILEALFQTDESGGYLIGQIGITAFHEGGYADLVDDVDWQDIYQEHNVMVDARLKANFRAGYWELIFKHTKPLGVIPKDMRAG